MEILNSIGIEPKLLIAQIVNFLLLLLVLYKFLYNPILKMLKDREERIEKSLKQCEDIEIKVENTAKEREEIILSARKESSKIIEEAKKTGESLKESMVLSAKDEAKEILENVKKDIEKEKELMFKEIKDDTADIIAQAVSSIVKKDSSKYDHAFVGDAVSEISREN